MSIGVHRAVLMARPEIGDPTEGYNFYANVTVNTTINQVSFKLNSNFEVDYGNGIWVAEAVQSFGIPVANNIKIRSVEFPTIFESRSGAYVLNMNILKSSTITKLTNAFLGHTKMDSLLIADTSNVTDFFQAFADCTLLTTLTLDFTSCTNLQATFTLCKNLATINGLTSSATANCDTLQLTFNGCWVFNNFPASFDTSNVISFDRTFNDCRAMTAAPLIDTTNPLLTELRQTFVDCWNMTSMPLIDTSGIETFESTWMGCNSLASFPQIDTSSAITLLFTWNNCSSLIAFPEIDVSNVTDMTEAWSGCTSLQTMPYLNTGNCTEFKNVFGACDALGCLTAINTLNAHEVLSGSSGTDSMFPIEGGVIRTVTNPDVNEQLVIEDVSAGGDDWISNAVCVVGNYTPLPVSAIISGNVVPNITQINIAAGGSTIIITLTNDAFVPNAGSSAGRFNLQRQAIINGITSDQNELNGWNAVVKPNIAVTDVVKTAHNQVTVTLPAISGYDITTPETIRVTVPASAMAKSTLHSLGSVEATPTFIAEEVAVNTWTVVTVSSTPPRELLVKPDLDSPADNGLGILNFVDGGVLDMTDAPQTNFFYPNGIFKEFTFATGTVQVFGAPSNEIPGAPSFTNVFAFQIIESAGTAFADEGITDSGVTIVY